MHSESANRVPAAMKGRWRSGRTGAARRGVVPRASHFGQNQALATVTVTRHLARVLDHLSCQEPVGSHSTQLELFFELISAIVSSPLALEPFLCLVSDLHRLVEYSWLHAQVKGGGLFTFKLVQTNTTVLELAVPLVTSDSQPPRAPMES